MKRRHFLQSLALATPALLVSSGVLAGYEGKHPSPGRIKVSLNAYSFNIPLRSGEMNLDDLLEYAAQTGFEAVDLTGYYFPGYPAVPSDDYIYHIKRKAFRLGIEICGTGVKNDLTIPDAKARKKEKQLIRNWIEVASKLGAQTLRIFAGQKTPDGYTWDQTAQWLAADVLECAQYAGQHGVVLALQNHNDFLKTASDVEKILQMIRSEWVGLMLDIGCYRTNPFEEIEQTIRHAVTWQVKEEMYFGDQVVKTDLDRLKKIIDASGYTGYLPIETLGPGDAKQKVSYMYQEVKKRF